MLFLPSISNVQQKMHHERKRINTKSVVKNYFYLRALTISKQPQKKCRQKVLTYR